MSFAVRFRIRLRSALGLVAALALAGSLAACSTTSATTGSGGGKGGAELRLGFFANVTHATPLVGVEKGFFAKELGSTRLKTQVFNAGPAAVEAIFAGAIDAAYLGPNPAINAFARSKGKAIRIIAGATSGGASLVVRPGITSAAQLRGKKIATPQLGGTQDVALRSWLASQGLKTDPSGKGDVEILANTQNAQTLQLFQAGRIDGGWLPEPWASRLVLEAGAKVLVDERTLWPQGRFVTTHLIVSTKFLTAHPETVAALLRGQVAANDWIAKHPAEAKAAVNAQLQKLAGKPLKPEVLDRAWSNIEVTNDPLASTLATSARHAEQAGLLEHTDLKGIYDLAPLNAILTKTGHPAVSDAGLGTE
ncbi:Aliphatic sulfonates family ABC transporter [Carbonactinospora thermoautotrophica]|uniref:Aliphatic sulfonates family ABC transporter n=1 Tax=Carbonactinospora thermoautotrophica TaxID=1469144 RepID=A0A132MWQ9_9ACTN|nr:ABC transporter substrate-binding protein [Carbonactinospora thermoautotrophica]KWX02140.1 Aliphatic sulfonates family ABC transporter [Carbonactinospora thermoautotrophica]